MDVDETAASESAPWTWNSDPEELRIVVQGALTADVLMELEGFGVRAAEPGLLLFGDVADQAALGGTLRRLHAAGLEITAVECRRHSLDLHRLPTSFTPASTDGRHTAQIEVDGTAPAAVTDLLDCVARRENPATTTLEFLVSDDKELFVVLDALDEWGLQLRTLVTGA